MENNIDNSLIENARHYITDKEVVTTGMLIRKFAIGFSRASSLMHELEEAGVIGPEESGGKHRVLMAKTSPRLHKKITNEQKLYFANKNSYNIKTSDFSVKSIFIEAILFIAKSVFPIFTVALCVFVIIISVSDYKNIIIAKSFSYFVPAFLKQMLKCIVVGDIIYYIWKSMHSNDKDYDKMEGHEFEYYCAKLLRSNGFKNVEVTQGSGDHGIDILAQKDKKTYAIQCKCYSSNIGNSAVQEAHAGKTIYDRDIAVVLTNRYFTKQAKEEAKILEVELWDRDYLKKLKH